MTFEELYQITDEVEQIQKTYELFNEDARLNRSKAARVEFLTTVSYIEKYLKPGDRILDVGAGAGEYSLYFSGQGFSVCALELAEANIEAFRKKIQPNMDLELNQGNAVDLSRYPDKAFDVVLLFGPLYHLHSEQDRKRAVSEARRVLKDDGTMFFAFIQNDMVILTEFLYDDKFFLGDTYNHDTFKLEDFPFVFLHLDQCRNLLTSEKIRILHEVASDGVSEMIEDKINAMDQESYRQYLRYHLHICEKPEMLGHSNHLLFAGKKH